MTKITRDYFQTLNRPQTEYLTFEYATFEADVWEAIRGNPLVLSVGFHRCKGLRDADLAFLASLSNLRQFYVCDSKLNGSFLQYLNASSTTYLSANYSLFPKENFRYLRDFGALKHLSLKKSGLAETIFSEIAANKRLRSLDLSYNAFSAGNPALQELTALVNFDLIGCRGTASVIPYLSTLPALTSLNLSASDVQDKDFESLNSSRLATLVPALNKAITDKALKSIRNLPKLEGLCLDGTSVSSEGLRILADGPAAVSLRSLDLREIQGFYPDVEFLFNHFPRLSALNLSYSKELEAELLNKGYKPDDSGDPVVWLSPKSKDKPTFWLHKPKLERDFYRAYPKTAPKEPEYDWDWGLKASIARQPASENRNSPGITNS